MSKGKPFSGNEKKRILESLRIALESVVNKYLKFIDREIHIKIKGIKITLSSTENKIESIEFEHEDLKDD